MRWIVFLTLILATGCSAAKHIKVDVSVEVENKDTAQNEDTSLVQDVEIE